MRADINVCRCVVRVTPRIDAVYLIGGLLWSVPVVQVTILFYRIGNYNHSTN